jgi:inner membrane protein
MPTRSLGLKFLLVCILAVLMAIPAFAIYGLIWERTSRATQVVAEVGARYGGEQTFLGPILAAPYRAVRAVPVTPGQPPQPATVEEGWYVVFAETGSADAVVETDIVQRGSLFKVRTYTADLAMRANFDLTGQPNAAPEGAVVDWSRAAFLIGVGDPRGAQGAAAEIVVEGGASLPLTPGSAYPQLFTGTALSAEEMNRSASSNRPYQWLAADAAAVVEAALAQGGDPSFSLRSSLRLSGVESIALAPFAKNTDLSVRSTNWPHVGYFGAFPQAEGAPEREAVAPEGAPEGVPEGVPEGLQQGLQDGGAYARWSIPFIARGVAAAGTMTDIQGLGSQDVRVRFIDPANPYQAVTRSLKYAILFLGVVFLFYFLFETTGEQRVHPAQYILVGLAQLIFYLLLLAIAERLGFNVAFVIAAGATVLLISFYAGAIFKSRARFLAALGSFSALYALIYMLMSLEDYALLAGSLAAFAAIAAVMWFTRNLDWYGLSDQGFRRPGADPPLQRNAAGGSG